MVINILKRQLVSHEYVGKLLFSKFFSQLRDFFNPAIRKQYIRIAYETKI